MDDIREAGLLSEENAARLLDRAVKLDAALGPHVSIEELRQVALEAGISEESFERALAEMRADPSSMPGGAPATLGTRAAGGNGLGGRSLLDRIRQRAGIFATGSVLAIMSQLFIHGMNMDDIPVILFTLVVAMFMAIGLAVTRRRNREVLDFEVDLGVLWTALTFWFMVANPGDAGDVLGVMMPVGLVSSLIGGLIVATGEQDQQPDRLPETT